MLSRLRKRRDLFATIAEEIDELLACKRIVHLNPDPVETKTPEVEEASKKATPTNTRNQQGRGSKVEEPKERKRSAHDESVQHMSFWERAGYEGGFWSGSGVKEKVGAVIFIALVVMTILLALV